MHRDVQIIILTGYPEYLTEDERGKFLDYMTKPVDVKKLYDTIVKALDIPADRINGIQARS
jgi:two-component SAPR family response regulator